MLEIEAYLRALLDKVVEEVGEVKNAAPGERVMELADVLEMLEAIMRAESHGEAHVREVQQQRREERGGFEQGLRLLKLVD